MTESIVEGRERLLGLLALKSRIGQADGEPKPMSLAWSAAKVRDFLRRADIMFIEKASGDFREFEGVVTDEDIKPVDTFAYRLYVDDGAGFAQVFITLPTHAGKKVRGAVAEYCCYVSNLMKAVKLTVDASDGEIEAEFAIPIAALLGDADREMERLVGFPMVMLGRYLPGLYEVLGGKSAQTAFKESRSVSSGPWRTP